MKKSALVTRISLIASLLFGMGVTPASASSLPYSGPSIIDMSAVELPTGLIWSDAAGNERQNGHHPLVSTDKAPTEKNTHPCSMGIKNTMGSKIDVEFKDAQVDGQSTDINGIEFLSDIVSIPAHGIKTFCLGWLANDQRIGTTFVVTATTLIPGKPSTVKAPATIKKLQKAGITNVTFNWVREGTSSTKLDMSFKTKKVKFLQVSKLSYVLNGHEYNLPLDFENNPRVLELWPTNGVETVRLSHTPELLVDRGKGAIPVTMEFTELKRSTLKITKTASIPKSLKLGLSYLYYRDDIQKTNFVMSFTNTSSKDIEYKISGITIAEWTAHDVTYVYVPAHSTVDTHPSQVTMTRLDGNVAFNKKLPLTNTTITALKPIKNNLTITGLPAGWKTRIIRHNYVGLLPTLNEIPLVVGLEVVPPAALQDAENYDIYSLEAHVTSLTDGFTPVDDMVNSNIRLSQTRSQEATFSVGLGILGWIPEELQSNAFDGLTQMSGAVTLQPHELSDVTWNVRAPSNIYFMNSYSAHPVLNYDSGADTNEMAVDLCSNGNGPTLYSLTGISVLTDRVYTGSDGTLDFSQSSCQTIYLPTIDGNWQYKVPNHLYGIQVNLTLAPIVP